MLLLALGIGANTAVFSLADPLLLQRLPVREPERLVELLRRYPGEPHLNGFDQRTYEFFRDRNRAFSNVIAVAGARAQSMRIERVSGNFFPALGIGAALGRLPGGSDGEGAAVLSWRLWQRDFGGDPKALGARIQVNGEVATVIGVLPREFTGLYAGIDDDVWLPLAERRGPVNLIARLKPGVTLAQARAEMSVLYRQSLDAHIAENQFTRAMAMEVEPAGAGLVTSVRDQFASPLRILGALVAALLLVACCNLAGMLLARGAAREKETAVRIALGAGTWRLARQRLTEALLLASIGAAAALLLAYPAARALGRIMVSGRDTVHFQPGIRIAPSIDGRVLLFTAATALAAALLFGAAPGLRALRARAARNGLIAAQVALAVALLSGAGLFIGYLDQLRDLDIGFRRDHLLLVSVDASAAGLKGAPLARAYGDLLGRFAAIPGVRGAALSGMTPISGAGANRNARVEGHDYRPGERRYLVENWVSPGFFATLGTPLLAGRDFEDADAGGPRVAIVNRALARYYFGDASPLGRHIVFEGDDTAYEIVGLVGDAKYTEIREDPERIVYIDVFQSFHGESQFSLRTAVDPGSLAAIARRVLREALPGASARRITTMGDQVDSTLVPERMTALLAGLFGSLALAIAAIGLYGSMAYAVERRVKEIGIRMALGATVGGITRLVIRDALATVAVGIDAGVPLALWGRRAAASWIAGLPREGFAFVAFGAAAMLAVAAAAAWIPARRAARVDPATALRAE